MRQHCSSLALRSSGISPFGLSCSPKYHGVHYNIMQSNLHCFRLSWAMGLTQFTISICLMHGCLCIIVLWLILAEFKWYPFSCISSQAWLLSHEPVLFMPSALAYGMTPITHRYFLPAQAMRQHCFMPSSQAQGWPLSCTVFMLAYAKRQHRIMPPSQADGSDPALHHFMPVP